MRALASRKLWEARYLPAGIAAGGTDDGPPGLRSYHAADYARFLRDPDGNRIEAVCHQAV